MTKDAVLLMAYGAASKVSEIPDYLQDIRGGRPVSEALVREVTERYLKMGGRSPLIDITRRQAQALEAELGLSVLIGMRHSGPTILAAVEALDKAEVERVVSFPLTPYRSSLSVGAYLKKLEEARTQAGASFEVLPVPDWHLEPDLVGGFTDKVAAARLRLPGAETLFTAHSLPASIRAAGDPYPEDFAAAAAAVAERLGLHSWKTAYQSKTVGAPDAWLGPDAAEAIDRLAAEGAKGVVVAPIGFLCDHMETLYDVDVLYREQAGRLGLKFERAASLNDSPSLIRALAAVARRALGR